MNTTITRTLQNIDLDDANFDDVIPAHVLTVPVSAGQRLGHQDTYTLGCHLHAALRRYEDSAELTSNERNLWPYVAELRNSLKGLGVQRIQAERPLEAHAGVPRGQCDLLLTGGLRRRGVVEVKVVEHLPEEPLTLNCLQLGGYLWLAARNDRFERWWGCVAYVSISERKIRLYAYRTIRPLVTRAAELFRAAA